MCNFLHLVLCTRNSKNERVISFYQTIRLFHHPVINLLVYSLIQFCFCVFKSPHLPLTPSVPPILHLAQTPILCLPGNGFTAGPHGRVSTRHQTAKSTCRGAPCLPWGEHGRWTLQVRNGTPGCDGLCSAGPGYHKCEIPRTEPDSSHDHLLEFKPSSFWGPSLCHFPTEPIHLNPVPVLSGPAVKS